MSGYIGGDTNNPSESRGPFSQALGSGLDRTAALKSKFKSKQARAGADTNAGYRQVCSGRTGHAEAVQLTYQKGSVGYGELVEFFYRTHDPTTLNAQGPDRGTRKFNPSWMHIYDCSLGRTR